MAGALTTLTATLADRQDPQPWRTKLAMAENPDDIA